MVIVFSVTHPSGLSWISGFSPLLAGSGARLLFCFVLSFTLPLVVSGAHANLIVPINLSFLASDNVLDIILSTRIIYGLVTGDSTKLEQWSSQNIDT